MKTLLLIPTLVVLPLFIFCHNGFLENKGQWDNQALFKFENGPNLIFLDKSGYTVQMYHPGDYENRRNKQHFHSGANGRTHEESSVNDSLRYHVYKVKFTGADFSKPAIKEGALTGYENFFIGNDPSRWASECRTYQKVTFKNIYDKIDLVYYYNGQQLKYDIIVHPGGNTNDIRLEYKGVNSLEIEKNDLIAKTSVGEVKEKTPYTYQEIDFKKNEISSHYKLEGSSVSFEISAYDPTKTLIIDPTIVFSSFSRSTGDNWGFTATYGNDGSFFGAGVASTTGFPTSIGAFQSTGGGGTMNLPTDIAIMKLSSNGSTREYATYLSGNGLEQPHSLIADADGNLVIMGRTNSTNFPVTVPIIGTSGGYDIFITKLNAEGTALIGSLRIGGSADDGVNITSNRANGPLSLLRNYGDDARSEVLLDENNNILIASCTKSVNFPTLNGFQSFSNGNQEGVVFKVNANCNAIIWSSYIGGSGDDAVFNIIKNSTTNRIYITGGTTSINFPGTSSSVVQQTYGGGNADGYCSVIIDNGSSASLNRSTYWGSNNIDLIYGVKLDAAGFVYVAGTSTGTMPVINANYFAFNSKQFITKFNPDLTSVVYSTNYGTSASAPNITIIAFHVDDCENVYVVGWGGGAYTFTNPAYPNSGTTGLPVTANGTQLTDGSDFYMFVLQKNAASQLYGSFFGQRGGFGGLDHVDGGTSRFDRNGTLYLATCANCKNVDSGLPQASFYPITAGVFGNINPASSGGACNMGMLKINFEFGAGCTTTSVRNINRDNTIKILISPNPNNGAFTLKFNHNNRQNKLLKIYNATGKMIFEKKLTLVPVQGLELVLDNKKPGVYFAELLDANGKQLATGKFVIEE